MERLHLDFVFARDLLQRRLGCFVDLIDGWSELYMDGVSWDSPPFWVVHCMWMAVDERPRDDDGGV